jgi:hypothetical protein
LCSHTLLYVVAQFALLCAHTSRTVPFAPLTYSRKETKEALLHTHTHAHTAVVTQLFLLVSLFFFSKGKYHRTKKTGQELHVTDNIVDPLFPFAFSLSFLP